MALYPTPGLKLLATLEAAPRAQKEFNGRHFIVAGTKLYEGIPTFDIHGVFTGLTPLVLSGATPLVNDLLPASMVANETQLVIASGGFVYIYYLATTVDSVTLLPVVAGTFKQVAASNFTLSTGNAPVIQVEFCDSFFLALIANSQTICISNVLDGNNWNFNGQIVVNVFPDNVVSMVVDHRELWLMGRNRTVVYFASGSLSVFDVSPGGYLEQGSGSTFAVSRLDNSIFWIGGDERGSGIGWRATGYNAQRITTHAVELAWQGYPKISDSVSYSYQDQGHTFWVIFFPSANNFLGATWVYDTASGLWHERDFLNTVTGIQQGHPSWNHAVVFGQHIVGDWSSGKLFWMNIKFLDNNGTPIVRLRRAPHISNEMEFIQHTQFQLDMETGLGPIPPLQGPGTPTIFTLKDSNNALWSVYVDDVGFLHTLAGSASTAQTIKLNDGGGTASWQLGVTITGFLTTTSIAFSSNPQSLLMGSQSAATAWNLGVTVAGNLTTTQNLQAFARDPQVGLRWSDDSGHTWSNMQLRPAGQAGNFKVRVVWRRLGRARVRTYEVTCSDPIPVRFIDAYVNASPGFSPSERITHELRKRA